MDLRSHANQLLAGAAETLKLERLEFNERDECIVTFDERVVVLFSLDLEDLNGIVINVLLGALPPEGKREAVMTELLSGNYCWARTEGGTIGVDRATGVITLSYLVELPLEVPEQFSDICAKLLNVADYWMRKIEETGGIAPETVPAGALSSGGIGPAMRV